MDLDARFLAGFFALARGLSDRIAPCSLGGRRSIAAINSLVFVRSSLDFFAMSDADDHFESPRIVLDSASQHINRLEGEIKAFFDTRPYARVTDYDPETGEDVYKVRLTGRMPRNVKAALKDSVGNLRDALDHAIYAAAVGLGNPSPERTGFPFANDATHLEGELGSWKFEDVPTEIHPLLMSFQPYPGGNDLLVSLNRIRNPNTHRMIVPVGFATLGNSIGAFNGRVVGPGKLGYSKWDATKNEVEFMRLGRGSKFQCEVHISFDVSFGDVGIVGGQPVIATLRQFATEVDRVVSAIEAETIRLKRA